jgi:arylformamidase
MRIHDVTVTIHPGMPIYEGDPGVAITKVSSIEGGDSADVSLYSLGSHTGTHVDPPRHFIQGGAPVDELPLDALIGLALVVETDLHEINRAFLEASGMEGAARVLFKTPNAGLMDRDGFVREFAHLTPDAAKYLVEQGVRLVGIDYLSIERFKSGSHDVHKTLLGGGVAVLEGLDLSSVGPGRYLLVCLPLKVKDGDGAPARVVLIEE